MIVKVYIGTEQIDLFKDENISVSSSIADTQDITKNTTEYSKTFTVPSTNNNDNIFKHYYNANIDNTFDARTKVDGRIELNGIPFKIGKFRLSKVIVKKSKPSSYTINFWGRLISFKNLFKNDELSSLDLSAYDHDLNSLNVRNGLESSLFSGDIIYNLLAKKQYYYNSDATDTTDTATLTNIAYNGGSNSIKLNDLRPSIKLKAVIDIIADKYGIVFTDDLFGRVEFDSLYMYLSNNTSKIGGGVQTVDFDSGDTTYVNLTTNLLTLQFSSHLSRTSTHLTITPASGYSSTPYRLKVYVNDSQISNNVYTGTDTKDHYFLAGTYDTGDEVRWDIECETEFSYTTKLKQRIDFGLPSDSTLYTYSSINTIGSIATITNEMPKIKVLEFLKGIFKMFKAVVIPLDDTNIYINTLKDYYSTGDLIDVTKYIDFKKYDVNRGKIFNEIYFQFEEPETILNKQFKINTGFYYGDEELLLEDESGEPLDGEQLEYKVPFEQVIYERLTDINDNSSTNIMYGAIIDDNAEETNIKPHIFYNINQPISGKTIAFKDELGVKHELSGNINTASHTIDFVDMPFSTIFGSEFDEWNGNIITNTLYYNYHKKYIESIFNIKRRNWSFSAYLPIYIITTLSLNDVLKIKGNYYRIDNYTVNLLTGETNLNLINSFENTLAGFTPLQSSFRVDYQEQRVSTYVATEDVFVFTNQDEGYGTGWITASNTGGNIYLDIDENTTETYRYMTILVQKKDLTLSFELEITQTFKEYVPSLDFSDRRNSWQLSLLTLKN